MVEEVDAVGSVAGASSADLTDGRESPRLYPAVPASQAPSAGARARAGAGTSAPDPIATSLSTINARLAGVNRVLELHIDTVSGMTVATIRDGRTGAVLQQFPSSDMVQLAEMLHAWAHGKGALLDLLA